MQTHVERLKEAVENNKEEAEKLEKMQEEEQENFGVRNTMRMTILHGFAFRRII